MYKTGRRCHPCVQISGAIDELGFWLARHPERAVGYKGPEPEEDDRISQKSFFDSDDEDTKGKKTKLASPWGQSETTIDEENNKENIDPSKSKLCRGEGDEEEEDIGNETVCLEESNGWMGL